MTVRPLLMTVPLLWCSACVDEEPGHRVAMARGPGEIAVVQERWISETDTAWDLDTPALWMDDGSAWVLVTAKGSHDLKVFDAATGRTLPTIGTEGVHLGDFRRPNAVLVRGDFAFVIERDNGRVQVLWMPSGEPMGSFGEGALGLPYGAAIGGSLPDLTLWVTDAEDGAAAGPEGPTRIHRFRIHVEPGLPPRVVDHMAWGEPDGPGSLTTVESIGLDEERGRLLVADEVSRHYLVYDTTGAFTGSYVGDGFVQGEPEGIALASCSDGSGYWILTDQRHDVSVFGLFRRDDLTPVGFFRGRVTSNTDGVAFEPGPVPGLDGPAFFAVHNDQGLAAFAWVDVVRAMGLDESCASSP